MKRIILFVLAFAIMACLQGAYAKSPYKNADAAVDKAKSIIKSFRESSEADVVSIGPLIINIAKPFVNDEPEAKAALKIAKGIYVADFESCSADVKSSFSSQMREYIDSLGDLKLMEMSDGEDNVIIIGDENKVSGMLVCSSDCEVVLIKLSAKPEELSQLLQIANN